MWTCTTCPQSSENSHSWDSHDVARRLMCSSSMGSTGLLGGQSIQSAPNVGSSRSLICCQHHGGPATSVFGIGESPIAGAYASSFVPLAGFLNALVLYVASTQDEISLRNDVQKNLGCCVLSSSRTRITDLPRSSRLASFSLLNALGVKKTFENGRNGLMSSCGP